MYDTTLFDIDMEDENTSSPPQANTRVQENDKIPSVKRKKQTIPRNIKKIVWNTHLGQNKGIAKCLCCNVTDISQMSFHCGHIISEANGGGITVNNLLPICQNCNSSMGAMNMNEFKAKYGIL